MMTVLVLFIMTMMVVMMRMSMRRRRGGGGEEEGRRRGGGGEEEGRRRGGGGEEEGRRRGGGGEEEGRRRGGGGRPRRITVTHADGWLIVVAGIASVCDPGAVFSFNSRCSIEQFVTRCSYSRWSLRDERFIQSHTGCVSSISLSHTMKIQLRQHSQVRSAFFQLNEILDLLEGTHRACIRAWATTEWHTSIGPLVLWFVCNFMQFTLNHSTSVVANACHKRQIALCKSSPERRNSSWAVFRSSTITGNIRSLDNYMMLVAPHSHW